MSNLSLSKICGVKHVHLCSSLNAEIILGDSAVNLLEKCMSPTSSDCVTVGGNGNSFKVFESVALSFIIADLHHISLSVQVVVGIYIPLSSLYKVPHFCAFCKAEIVLSNLTIKFLEECSAPMEGD